MERIHHTGECLDFQRSMQLEADDFERQYPKYCRSCAGTGGQSYGGGLYEPPGFDVCAKCQEELRCSLCMEYAPEESFGDPNFILPCGHPVEPLVSYPFFDFCVCDEQEAQEGRNG